MKYDNDFWNVKFSNVNFRNISFTKFTSFLVKPEK